MLKYQQKYQLTPHFQLIKTLSYHQLTMKQLFTLIQSKKQTKISLHPQQSNNQLSYLQTQIHQQNSNILEKPSSNYKQKHSFGQTNQFIYEVIFIEDNIICTVSQKQINFYSIERKTTQNDLIEQVQNESQKQNSQKQNRYLGQIDIYRDIRSLFKQNQSNNLKINQNQLSQQQQQQSKQAKEMFCFNTPSFVQEKGVIYCTKTKIFYTLIQTNANKYLICFNLIINRKQNPFIAIDNFKVLYNCALPQMPIKYDLQLSPQLIYLQKSSIVVLIRKFYSDSLITIFKPQIQCSTNLIKSQSKGSQSQCGQPLQNQNHQQKNNNRIKQMFNLKEQQQNKVSPIHWQFYINQECLSSLDDCFYLVNYRQLITKYYAQIQLIDIINKQRIIHKITQSIEPLTIKNIQTASLQNSYNKNLNINANRNSTLKLRIFTLLRKQQSTYIIDYDTTHAIVQNTYKIPLFLIQNLSFYHPYQQYQFATFLNQNNQLFITLLQKDLSFLNQNTNKQTLTPLEKLKYKQANQQKQNQIQKQINNLTLISIQSDLDSYLWNINRQIILKYNISLNNKQITLSTSQTINKNILYMKIINQLQTKHQNQFVHQNYQFLQTIWKVLENNKPCNHIHQSNTTKYITQSI